MGRDPDPLIEANKFAEQQAIAIKVAALDRAEAVRVAAEVEGEKARISANAKADAERAHAEAQQAVYAVEAEGQRALNEAANLLSAEQIAMQVKLELLRVLPDIIAQSVKPISAIDGIKIVQVDGIGGGASSSGGNGDSAGASVTGGSGGNLADQAIAAALRYRSQAPILDNLLNEVGLKGGSLSELAGASMIDEVLSTKAPPCANPTATVATTMARMPRADPALTS